MCKGSFCLAEAAQQSLRSLKKRAQAIRTAHTYLPFMDHIGMGCTFDLPKQGTVPAHLGGGHIVHVPMLPVGIVSVRVTLLATSDAGDPAGHLWMPVMRHTRLELEVRDGDGDLEVDDVIATATLRLDEGEAASILANTVVRYARHAKHLAGGSKLGQIRSVFGQDLSWLFKHADKNGDGKISMQEFKVTLRANVSLADSQLTRIFKLADVERTGFLQYDQFVKAILNAAGATCGADRRHSRCIALRRRVLKSCAPWSCMRGGCIFAPP